MKHFKNDSIITDTKTILSRPGKRFSKFQRVGLQGIEFYFFDDADLQAVGKAIKLIVCGFGKSNLHKPN